jgi:ribosome-associated protein YbcJ (S4-like RNA binding protein)
MEFASKLRLQIQSAAPNVENAMRFPKIPFTELSPMNPALVACLVFSFAAILCFSYWWQQRTPQISSNTLLVRAEKWDTPSFAPTSGVVYQSVRINLSKQMKKETITRSIYRDTQGKRRPKRVNLDAAEQQLQSTLIAAGLDWDEPLSATGYQNWHDHQRVREDNIVRAGSHLLRLTTTVPDGPVTEQSLTVRDTDFHAVKRTVALRDSSTVEIAELDYKILPWAAVDANLFEPIGGLDTSMTRPGRVLSFPRIPEMPSESQLDEAELGALLILNRLHADTGEEVKIRRSEGIVAVDGLVEDERRKRQLQSQLATVPHLTVSIRSIDELRKTPDAGGAVTSVKAASMQDQPSPLEKYLEARGQSVNGVNGLAERFFNSALTISQESKAIADLETRFATENQMTILASATRADLIYSHRERLEEALKEERRLLSEVRRTGSGNGTSARDRLSLLNGAEKNLALSKELIETDSASPRNAESILTEMSATVDELTAAVQLTYEKPRSESALSGKK